MGAKRAECITMVIYRLFILRSLLIGSIAMEITTIFSPFLGLYALVSTSAVGDIPDSRKVKLQKVEIGVVRLPSLLFPAQRKCCHHCCKTGEWNGTRPRRELVDTAVVQVALSREANSIRFS